jgi:hypothetical protein
VDRGRASPSSRGRNLLRLARIIPASLPLLVSRPAQEAVPYRHPWQAGACPNPHSPLHVPLPSEPISCFTARGTQPLLMVHRFYSVIQCYFGLFTGGNGVLGVSCSSVLSSPQSLSHRLSFFLFLCAHLRDSLQQPGDSDDGSGEHSPKGRKPRPSRRRLDRSLFHSVSGRSGGGGSDSSVSSVSSASSTSISTSPLWEDSPAVADAVTHGAAVIAGLVRLKTIPFQEVCHTSPLPNKLPVRSGVLKPFAPCSGTCGMCACGSTCCAWGCTYRPFGETR